MPRGRRTSAASLADLEQEVALLKARQAEIRAQIRKMKMGAGGLRKLEEKLERQFASARWTASQIKQVQPDWDELGFYQTVQPTPPTPRGRRRRAAP